MAGKALNKANLVGLGPDALADLLLEAVKGDAARQRRVRMALAAGQGPETVAADVRKRFASMRRGRGYISRKRQKTLGKELSDLTRLIETAIAPEAPDLAFDLLWAQLHLGDDLCARTDDSRDILSDTMHEVMEAVGRIAPNLSMSPTLLAESICEAMRDDGHGIFDLAVQALAPALGDAGLAHLKAQAEAARAVPLTAAQLARFGFIHNAEDRAARARAARDRGASIILEDVADLQGDVDTWLAQYTSDQLALRTIAPAAAARLLEAGRAEEALQMIETARAGHDDRWSDPRELDDMRFACLDALGRKDDLRAALWDRFTTRLCPDALRHHLKLLPDFEDIEAEDAARRHVLGFVPVEASLSYCHASHDHALAAQLIDTRQAEIDGDAYEVLTPLAEDLAATHPLSAVLLWRAMIDFALTRARKGRYGHAARHLMACEAADALIEDYGSHASHAAYLADLSERHARKAAFWGRVGTGKA